MRYSNRPKRIVRLTESDLTRIIRRVISEAKITEPEPLGTALKNRFGSRKKYEDDVLNQLDADGLLLKSIDQKIGGGGFKFLVFEIDDPKSGVEYLIMMEDRLPLSIAYQENRSEGGNYYNTIVYKPFGDKNADYNKESVKDNKKVLEILNQGLRQGPYDDPSGQKLESLKFILASIGQEFKPRVPKS